MSLVPIFNGQEQERPLFSGNMRATAPSELVTGMSPWRHGQDDVNWELYDLSKDRSESNNLAKTHPEKLESMIKFWTEQAERTQVTPWPKFTKSKKRKLKKK